MPRITQNNKDENTVQLGRKRHSLRNLRIRSINLENKQHQPKSRVPFKPLENQAKTPIFEQKMKEPIKLQHKNIILKIYADPRFNAFPEPNALDIFQYGSHSKCVFAYLGDIEHYSIVPEGFLISNGEISPSMRAVLINWLIQVHLRFNLVQETLFISVQLLDRYISQTKIPKAELQLVGVTCLLLAAKYEEQIVPEIADFIHVTDYSVKVDEIREAERSILIALDHDLSPPISLQFLRRLTKTCQVTQMVHNLSKFFLEVSLYDPLISELKPSIIAAACVALGAIALGHTHLKNLVEIVSGYDHNSLIIVMRRIPEIFKQNKEFGLSALFHKYSLVNFGRVSDLPLLNSEQFLSFKYFDI